MPAPILLPGAGRSTGFAQNIRLLEVITSAATLISGRASKFYSQVWGVPSALKIQFRGPTANPEPLGTSATPQLEESNRRPEPPLFY